MALDEQAPAVARHQGRQKGRQGGDADHRNAGREADAAGGRNADPQSRIAAGADRHGNPIQALEASLEGETSRSISGSRASACPRSIGMVSRASISPVTVSCMQAEQAPRAVSMARTRKGSSPSGARLFRAGSPPGEGA